MQIILTILVASLFWGCDQCTTLHPDPPIIEQDTILELIWATRLDSGKEIVGTDNTLSYKEWILVGGDIGFPPTIMAFNKDTGEKDWELVFDDLQGDEITYMFLFDNILVARNSYLVFAVNLDTHELLWDENLEVKMMRLGRGCQASNKKYYQTAVFNFDPLGGGVQHLYEFNPETGENHMVYSRAPDSIGTKTISPPVIWEDVENNRMMFIVNERPNSATPPQDTKQDIVAIDIETKEIVWKTRVNDGFASNGLHPPVIYNDIVITGGDWHMYAFDIRTGEQVWKTEITNNSPYALFSNTNHLIHNGRLYVNEVGENVTCLNAETGEILWNNPKGGANCTDNMIYYEKENLLVFTSWGYGSIMILDALTGETLHQEHRFDNSSYNNDIVYDKGRDMFFTSTYKHVVAFKVKR